MSTVKATLSLCLNFRVKNLTENHLKLSTALYFDLDMHLKSPDE